MNTDATGARQRTRRAILEALADVITETKGIGFSVQAVADRAGVSHRTVYNHFPTREVLCEAFGDYVDEMLGAVSPPLDLDLTLTSLPDVAGRLYHLLELRDRYVRAGVMLMIGNRRPTKVWRERTLAIEKLIAAAPATLAPPPRQVAAAVRIFVSSIGWHLLTEQCGLSTDEAAATSTWASRVLLEAAKGEQRASRTRRR